MKYQLKKCISLYSTTGLLLWMLSFPLTALEQYSLDPNHTYVLWHANHFGFSNPSGKWLVKGTIAYDPANIQNSKVEVMINVSDMITGIPELDKHLKGKLFFDTSRFPVATFISTKIDATNNTLSKITGILTVHGISKPITLDAKINKIGKNPINDKETIGFSAGAQLKRSEFGINTLIPGISDEIMIQIEGEATANANGKANDNANSNNYKKE